MSLELKRNEFSVLVYSSWTSRGRFFHLAVLLFAATSVSMLVWAMSDGSVMMTCLSFLLLAMMMGAAFWPRSIELNENGIYRGLGGLLGNRWHYTTWEEIVSYKKMKDGVLLILNQERYLLDSFRSIFIPVPRHLIDEVEKRLHFYVDNLPA